MTDPLGRSEDDITRESTELVAAERARARTIGFSLEQDINAPLDQWERTLGEYFDKAKQAAASLDADNDGDIDLDDVQDRLVKFAGIGIAWLDAFRSKTGR